jgi:YHS domain-containing protein
MKRILCLLITFGFAGFFLSYLSSTVMATGKKGTEEVQKQNKKNTAIDCVCGMQVDKDKALKVKHDGKMHYFCSKKCEEAFKKDPSKYAKKGEKLKEEKKKETKEKEHND